MENRTPQRDKAVRTRQRLLEATLAQTAACGYHNITVDKIAAAAGVSTGSAYRYFRNKKEMLLAALAYHYENIQDFSGHRIPASAPFPRQRTCLPTCLGSSMACTGILCPPRGIREPAPYRPGCPGCLSPDSARCSRYPRAEMSPRIRRTSGAQGTHLFRYPASGKLCAHPAGDFPLQSV